METQQSQYGTTKDPKTSSMSSSMSGNTGVSSGSITDKVKTGIDQLESKLSDIPIREQLNQVKSKAQDAYQASLGFVKANPMSAVLGAAALGFVAAAFFRRGTEE